MAAGSIPFVGLTGGLGSGKSTALALLGELGAATTSADAIVHALYEHDPALRAAVVARWGDGVLAADGSIDRAAVARHAFASDAERRWLEQLIWPMVGAATWQFREDAAAAAAAGGPDAPRAAVVETPLLFEAGLEAAYDATIAVIAPEHLRAARAAARGHEAVDERAKAQLSQEEKAQRAGHVVVNDGDLDQLRERLAAVLDEIAPVAG